MAVFPISVYLARKGIFRFKGCVPNVAGYHGRIARIPIPEVVVVPNDPWIPRDRRDPDPVDSRETQSGLNSWIRNGAPRVPFPVKGNETGAGQMEKTDRTGNTFNGSTRCAIPGACSTAGDARLAPFLPNPLATKRGNEGRSRNSPPRVQVTRHYSRYNLP